MIDWGNKDTNESHYAPLLEQHRGLMLSGGVLMKQIEHTEQF
jgi:hypothetical protein